MIEQRRLVRLGRSTLVVSLPAEWIRKQGLKAGDLLSLIVTDNYIKLVPVKRQGLKQLKAKIVVKKNVNALYRAIIAAYIAGADIIEVEIEDSSKLLEALRNVRYATSHLIGVEIVNQDTHRITLQTFIGTEEQNVIYLMKRMINMLTLMLKYVLEPQREDLGEYLEEFENEIDKLYRLALRRLNLSDEEDKLMSALLTFLENVSDTLLPLYEVSKSELKGVYDALNVVLETLEFMSRYEPKGYNMIELDERISIVEHVEHELTKRNVDEKVKYRALLVLHNLKNALLMLYNMEVEKVIETKGVIEV